MTVCAIGKTHRGVAIEDRLGDNETSAGGGFTIEKFQLPIDLFAIRIADDPGKKLRERFQKLFALPRIAAIEFLDHLQETEGIEVMNGSCTRAAVRRQLIALQSHHTVDTKRGGSEQIGLESEAIAVTAREI